MLCDSFIEADENSVPDPLMRRGIARFNRVLKTAPKYILTENVVQMVETLSAKRPSAILKGLPVCFLPHPVIWVEQSYGDFLRALERLEPGSVKGLRQFDEAPAPHRIGYLFEELPDGYMQITLGWEHRNTIIEGQFFKSMLHLCLLNWKINSKANFNGPL